MGEIVIAPGETKKIVSQPGTDESYNIDVSNADIYLSHNEARTQNEGKRVQSGDRVTINNLRGQPMYAKNPPENTENASVRIDEASFNLIFQPRSIVGSVLTGDNNEAAPANDDDLHLFGKSHDVFAEEVSHAFEAPDAADSVVISVDDATGAFGVVVEFLDGPGGNVLTARDKDNNPDYGGGSGSDVYVEVTGVASPFVRVRILDESGAANTLDYSIYAR